MRYLEKVSNLLGSPLFNRRKKVVVPDIFLEKDPFAGIGPFPLSVVYQWLTSSWIKETSAEPDMWSYTNSSRGQSAVTSMLLYTLFRSQEPVSIVNTEVHLPQGEKVSHYAVSFYDRDLVVDFTTDQFPHTAEILPFTPKVGKYATPWRYLTQSKQTLGRYRLLEKRFMSLFVPEVFRQLKSGRLDYDHALFAPYVPEPEHELTPAEIEGLWE